MLRTHRFDVGQTGDRDEVRRHLCFVVGLGRRGHPVILSMAKRGHAFRWREEESLTSGKTILRPTLDLELRLGVERTATKALVDTGAPRTIFPRGVGDLLGIEFPTLASDAPTRITVLGRVWPAVSETVQLKLKGVEADVWEAEVDFVVEEGLPFALLGYEGFLNHWAVGINGYTGYFFVEAIDDFDERHAEAIDQLAPRR